MTDYRSGFFVADEREAQDVATRSLEKMGRQRCPSVLVFAHPHQDFVKKHVVPMVGYWNFRSEDTVHFFFMGFQGDTDRRGKYFTRVFENNFSDEAFVEAVKSFEEKSTWHYSGRASVLITEAVMNYRKSDNDKRAFFSKDAVMAFDLEAAVESKAIDSTATFFEELIRVFATDYDATAGDLSNRLGGRRLAGAGFEGLLESLPIKGVGRFLKSSSFFSVKRLATR